MPEVAYRVVMMHDLMGPKTCSTVVPCEDYDASGRNICYDIALLEWGAVGGLAAGGRC